MNDSREPSGSARRVARFAPLAVVAVIAVVALVAYLLARTGAGSLDASGTGAATLATATTTAPTPESTTSAPTTTAALTPSSPSPQSSVTVPRPVPTGPDLALPYYEGRVYGCTTHGDDISSTFVPPTKPVTTYIYPGDGSPRIPVPLGATEKVTKFAALGNDYLLAVSDCTTLQIRRYAPDGTYKILSRSTPVPAVDQFVTGAGMVATTFKPGQVTLFDAATGKRLNTWKTGFASTDPWHVLPDGSVLVGVPVHRVGMTTAGERRLLPDGTITGVNNRLANARGVNPATGDVISSAPYRVCDGGVANTAVYDSQTGQPHWIDCGYFAEYGDTSAASPDGSLIAATDEHDQLSFLDAATGEVRVTFLHDPCKSVCAIPPVWEDDTHLVYLADLTPAPYTGGTTTGRFTLYRFGLDGTVETASVAQPPAKKGGFGWELLWSS